MHVAYILIRARNFQLIAMIDERLAAIQRLESQGLSQSGDIPLRPRLHSRPNFFALGTIFFVVRAGLLGAMGSINRIS